MPTITQLPAVADVTAADAIPVSQNGLTRSVSVGALLSSTQPAIISDSGTLLGRNSLGAGGPEPVTVGPGLLLNNGTLTAPAFDPADLPQRTTVSPTDQAVLSANGQLAQLPVASLRGLFSAGANISIDANGTISASATDGGVSSSYSITNLTPVVTIASGDLVAISQGGADRTISYANLLDGLTIDAASAAAPPSDTDAFWVGQGSSTMLAQSFGAVWSWCKSKLPTYRRPVVEIAANTTLDGTIHNGAILVCSQPVTLTPAFVNMSSGFTCSVVNVSSGNVTFGAGVITSSGTQTLPTGQAAELRAFSYTGGNVVFAGIAGGGAVAQPPGQVTGLAVGVTTPSSVALTWQAPGTGGSATGYTVNYRVTSTGGTWTPQSSAGTSLTVSGLAAATQYDFEVIANNAAGGGPASSVLTGTTQAAPTQAPGQVTGLTTSGPTASTVNLAWTPPSTGGTVASYTAQYRVTGGTGWNTAASGISGTGYMVTGLAAATSYDFQVFAVNSAGAGAASAVTTAVTTIAVPGLPTSLAAGAATGTTMPLSWTAPASGGAVTSYSVRWSLHAANTWTVVANVSSTATTISGLTVSTSYDFEVEAVNSGGNGGWTAAITAATTSGGNYLLTAGFLPAAGATWQTGQGGIGVNCNDNSSTGDGSHTVPASVQFALSLSNSVVPVNAGAGAADLETGSQFSNGGHNYWAGYMNAPAAPGNYYLWAIAKDAGGNVAATVCWPSPFTVHT
jgi:hypothetical protein